MKFTFLPTSKISLYFYFAGIPLVIFGWIDQWLQLFLVTDKLRIQLFIAGIIIIAVAAIINLSLFIISLYQPRNNKNNPADDH